MNMQVHQQSAHPSRLSSPEIYDFIAEEGREELARPSVSLTWSGLAAGIGISFSLLAQAYFAKYLPEGDAYALIAKMGYVFGFMIVILSRLQLFTENTITVILPLLERRTKRNVFRTLRLWGIVFTTNILGTFLVAATLAFSGYGGPELLGILREISLHAVDHGFWEIFFLGIPAGFLIAAIVWMRPTSGSGEFFVIFLMIYLIALGDFSHVIVGSAEAFLSAFTGDITPLHAAKYICAAALGNIIGGTGLFALLAYGQVHREI